MFFGRFVLVALGIVYAVNLQAQTQENGWLRVTLSKEFDPKWSLDLEGQYRRQSIGTQNHPIGENLLVSGRTWVNYKYNPNVKFSISPFAYLQHQELMVEVGSEKPRIARKEIRFSVASNLNFPLGEHLKLTTRPAVEYRQFIAENMKNFRVRSKFGINYQANKKLNFQTYYEVFFNTFSKADVRKLDQERVGLQMDYTFNKHFKMELGYIYLVRQLPIRQWRESNFVMQFCYCI